MIDIRPEELSARSATLKADQIHSNVSEVLTIFYYSYSVKIGKQKSAADGARANVPGVSKVC